MKKLIILFALCLVPFAQANSLWAANHAVYRQGTFSGQIVSSGGYVQASLGIGSNAVAIGVSGTWTGATLTVSIDANYLRIKFGYGIFRKRFAVSEIASAQRVKNHWYYGWGIRLWLWPTMWIYNISGFDAVEIIMRNGKIYRIGTDTPGELEAAIKQAINT